MVTVKLVKVKDTSDDSGSEQLGYTIKNFESFNINLRTPISPMPLPEEKSGENVLVKMEGNTQVINLAWTLVESTTDLSFGNQSDANTLIKTVPQQLVYLSDALEGSSLQEKFNATIEKLKHVVINLVNRLEKNI